MLALMRVLNTILRWLKFEVRYRCGHLGPRDYKVTLWGHDLGRKYDPRLERERCPRCEVSHLEEVSVRCADPDCGRPILPGDAICVVIPGGSWPAPWSRWIGESVVLGACCGSGADYSGNWGLGKYALLPGDLPRGERSSG